MIDNKKNNSGFTLIEMAMVIVIVAIIAFAALYGSDIVENYRMRSVINDITSFRTSVAAFKLQYDQMPGDMPDAATYWPTCDDNDNPGGPLIVTCNGDGDKLTEDCVSGDGQICEDRWAFGHMAFAKVVRGGYSGVGGFIPGITVPSSKYGTATGYRFYYNRSGESINSVVTRKHAFRFGKNSSNGLRDGVMSAVSTSSIDTKIDDGKASSGFVMAKEANNSPGTCIDEGATPDEYFYRDKQISCLVWFWIDDL